MRQKSQMPRERMSIKTNARYHRDQLDRELTTIVEDSVVRVLGKVDALMVKFEEKGSAQKDP